ncbi:MAG: MerR family transcriptional regulator [Chloroflexota bacterium]|nr:MerR family transcriptional regulator [Chloroflexota bacterium]
MGLDDSEPRYVISIAARMIGVRTYTLRYYEKVGIIEPSRSPGNIRLYSEQDIARLRTAKTLMDDMGVNLAGVEVIMRIAQHTADLQHRLEELEAEMEELHQPPSSSRSVSPPGL